MIDPRQLPVRVRPYPAETVSSYFRRLSIWNSVPERDLWKIVRDADPEVPMTVSPSAAPDIVARLGGIPAWCFGERLGPAIRCVHEPGWWKRRCYNCRCGYGTVTMCQRCACGEVVTTTQQVGPICVRHKRWHAGGLDIDVSHLPAHLSAQRHLNRSLHMRFISHRTPEAAVARGLIHGWYDGPRPLNAVLDPDQEIEDFPVVVALLERLSAPVVLKMVREQPASGKAMRETLLNMTPANEEPTDERPRLRLGPAVAGDLLSHLTRRRQHRQDPLWEIHEASERRRRDFDSIRHQTERLRAKHAVLARRREGSDDWRAEQAEYRRQAATVLASMKAYARTMPT